MLRNRVLHGANERLEPYEGKLSRTVLRGGGSGNADTPLPDYLAQQPDLNWRNPAVQAAMFDAMRFWLDRGVDGFRIDALRQLIKDDQFRPNPPNPDYRPGSDPYHELLPTYTTDRPEVQEIVRTMRRIVDEYDERVLIGELYLPIERLVVYYGVDGSGLHLPFNFHLILTPWHARQIAALIEAYEAALPPYGWPNWVLGNHDQHRIVSRIGPEQARVAALLLLTLRGTPTFYNGDELGMRDVTIPPDRVQDPFEKNVPGKGLGRDPERTPMQWDSSPNAGFTVGTPWLPIADDYATVNVASERDDEGSMLALYHRLIELRRATPALAVGSYTPVEVQGDLLAYVREAEDQRYLIALNLGHTETQLAPVLAAHRGRIILSTHGDRVDEAVTDALALRGDEGVIVAIGA